jgi:hypothetical protein
MKTNQAVVVRRPRTGLAITMLVTVLVFGAPLDLKAQSSNSPVVATLPVGTTPYGLAVRQVPALANFCVAWQKRVNDSYSGSDTLSIPASTEERLEKTA